MEIQSGDQIRIPLAAEELKIKKRKRLTAKVHIQKKVHQHEQTVNEPLLKEEVIIERVPIGRYVESAEVKSDGDTLIIPVMEEVLVIEKRLLLKEELRVTKRKITVQDQRSIVLRSEEAVIEREEFKNDVIPQDT